MDEVFDLKKLQQEQRSQKVAEFGEICDKLDCKYYFVHPNRKKGCTILRTLYCKYEMCHFYDKKE